MSIGRPQKRTSSLRGLVLGLALGLVLIGALAAFGLAISLFKPLTPEALLIRAVEGYVLSPNKHLTLKGQVSLPWLEGPIGPPLEVTLVNSSQLSFKGPRGFQEIKGSWRGLGLAFKRFQGPGATYYQLPFVRAIGTINPIKAASYYQDQLGLRLNDKTLGFELLKLLLEVYPSFKRAALGYLKSEPSSQAITVNRKGQLRWEVTKDQAYWTLRALKETVFLSPKWRQLLVRYDTKNRFVTQTAFNDNFMGPVNTLLDRLAREETQNQTQGSQYIQPRVVVVTIDFDWLRRPLAFTLQSEPQGIIQGTSQAVKSPLILSGTLSYQKKRLPTLVISDQSIVREMRPEGLRTLFLALVAQGTNATNATDEGLFQQGMQVGSKLEELLFFE